MPEPIRSTPPRTVETNPLPMQAPSVAPTPDAPQTYFDMAVASLERAQSADSTEGAPTLSGLLRDLYAAYRENGGAGVHALLSSHPEALEAFAGLSSESLEGAIADANGFHGFFDGLLNRAGTLAGLVREHLEGALRSRILQQGRTAGARLAGQLDAIAASLPESIERMRSAEPGTPDAQLATLLGVRGDDGDLSRAQSTIERLRDSIASFADRIAGFTWEPGDFPRAAERGLRSLGLGSCAEGSVGREVASETTSDTAEEALDFVTFVSKLAFESHEIGDAVHGLAAGISAGSVAGAATVALPIVLGLAIEHMLSHQSEIDRAQFQATGHMLGL
jgi:hypothetical protein